MKTSVKVACGFIIGAGVGATAATLYLRNFYTKYINETLTDEINKEMDKIKKEYEQAVNDIKKEQTEEKEPEVEVEVEEVKEPVKKTKAKKKEQAIDYTKCSEDKKKGKKVKDTRTQIMEEIAQETTNDIGTYIIGFNDYTEDNGYEKVTATRYACGTYTNDYDDPDPDMDYIVGNLVELKDDYGEGDCLYLRNDQKETDYEIIFDAGAYGE
mgnify:FL=1